MAVSGSVGFCSEFCIPFLHLHHPCYTYTAQKSRRLAASQLGGLQADRLGDSAERRGCFHMAWQMPLALHPGTGLHKLLVSTIPLQPSPSGSRDLRGLGYFNALLAPGRPGCPLGLPSVPPGQPLEAAQLANAQFLLGLGSSQMCKLD